MERIAPPAQWAASYASMGRTYSPPPRTGPSAYRVLPGTSVYPAPPPGCRWASEVCWWTVRPGTVALRVRRVGPEHNGHHLIQAAIVDLCLGEDEPVLEGVGLPSVSLTRDVEHMTRWTAVEITRAGRRRPWCGAAVDAGPIADLAAELSGEGDE